MKLDAWPVVMDDLDHRVTKLDGMFKKKKVSLTTTEAKAMKLAHNALVTFDPTFEFKNND